VHPGLPKYSAQYSWWCTVNEGYEQFHTTIDQQHHMDICIAHSTYDDPNFEFNVSTTKSSAIVKFVTNSVKSSDESDYAVISQDYPSFDITNNQNHALSVVTTNNNSEIDYIWSH